MVGVVVGGGGGWGVLRYDKKGVVGLSTCREYLTQAIPKKGYL